MTPRPHGTRAKYAFEKCRCADCRAANSRYEKERRNRNQGAFQVRHARMTGVFVVTRRGKPGVLYRGTSRADAYRVRNEMNAAIATESPIWASGGTVHQVRAYIRKLQKRGIGLKRISVASGVTYTRILELMNGRSYTKDRPRHRRLKSTTAEKIMGVMVTTRPAGGARIDAGPTWKLVHALLGAGYTRGQIARELGATRRALQLGKATVLGSTAARVEALHARVFFRRTDGSQG